jgi:hypothetical protein
MTSSYVLITASFTLDLKTGKIYVGGGLTTPSVGFSDEYGLAIPFIGHSAEEVITEWSLSGQLSTPIYGPSGSVSLNDTGMMTTVGYGVGTGGPSVSATWTWSYSDAVDWLAGLIGPISPFRP